MKPDLDDDEKSRKRSKCHTRLASWSPKGRSVVGITVLDEEGSPTSDKGAFETLRSHWEPVFNNVVGGRRAFNRFSRFVQKCPGGVEPLGREEFRIICGVSRRSAPGPDGIGYMAWRAGGEIAADIAYDCYKQILDGGLVPCWFNKSTLVFILKGEP